MSSVIQYSGFFNIYPYFIFMFIKRSPFCCFTTLKLLVDHENNSLFLDPNKSRYFTTCDDFTLINTYLQKELRSWIVHDDNKMFVFIMALTKVLLKSK